MSLTRSRTIILGLALFSMFFGSGNLIYPLSVGATTEGEYLWGALGFVLSGVLVPFLGVLTMVLYSGSYKKFFSCLGTWPGLLFAFAILCAWIPLGSGPRCITLSYGVISPYLGNVPLWVYALLYSGLVWLFCVEESHLITILGKWLTPVLLLCLGSMIFFGAMGELASASAEMTSFGALSQGITEGYYTQDGIAAFFFAAAVIHLLKTNDHLSSESAVATTLKSGCIGMGLLATVYLGLLYLGAAYAEVLDGVSKDVLLPTLAHHLLGGQFSFVVATAVSLACLTTSIALMVVFEDFLRQEFGLPKPLALAVAVSSSFVMALFGFEGVSVVISYLMSLFYPLLILLIFVRLFFLFFKGKSEENSCLMPKNG